MARNGMFKQASNLVSITLEATSNTVYEALTTVSNVARVGRIMTEEAIASSQEDYIDSVISLTKRRATGAKELAELDVPDADIQELLSIRSINQH